METHYQSLIAPGQIDSVLKLRLVLVFAESPWLRVTKHTMQQRIQESPWALSEALEELAEAGLLARSDRQGQREFRITAVPERRARLDRLAATFDDPQQRDDLYTQVRRAGEERTFRDALALRVRTSGAYDVEFVV